jgi:transcriptional regulator with XRE-family HTH domain
MQRPIGEIIRQIRQMRKLTQRELAGDQFSKSYVSAVEHNRIAPSSRALRFFAERLGQPNGNFAALLQQPEVVRELSLLDTPPLALTNGHIRQDDAVALLERLLKDAEFARFFPHHDLPVVAPEVLASFPPHLQAHYHLLLGLSAKEKRNLHEALRAFESALALAPGNQQAVILDEVGNTYFLMQEYLPALGYHLHALHLLSKEPSKCTTAWLQFDIELHCGKSYRALGAYQYALEHYEYARTHLSSRHGLSTAGQLYAELGYCTYAAIYPATMLSAPSRQHSDVTPERIEGEFQRAISYLLQSRSFYQVSDDRLGEAKVRLRLASVLLDLSAWRRRMASERARNTKKRPSFTDCAPLLNDAAEQCQQVLLAWQASSEHAEVPPAELHIILYEALANLIRISVQRATLARLEGSYIDVAYRERAFAAYLCQQVLDTLSNPALPWAVIQQTVPASADTLIYRSPSLPHLTDLPTELSDSSPHGLLSLVEVYFATAEVAEELGDVSIVQNYAHDCYVQANQYFQAALTLAHVALMKGEGERDPGYLVRLYQHCITLLEERAFAWPALYEETTKVFLGVLKQGLWQLQSLLLDKKPPHSQDNKR